MASLTERIKVLGENDIPAFSVSYIYLFLLKKSASLPCRVEVERNQVLLTMFIS